MFMDTFGENEMPRAMRNHTYQLHGTRPPPLRINNDSLKITKPQPKNQKRNHLSPTIIYIETPKTIHVKPEEFKVLVQRLTGQNQASASSSSSSKHEMASERKDSKYDSSSLAHEENSGGSHEEAQPVFSSLAPLGTCPMGCPSFCIHVYDDD